MSKELVFPCVLLSVIFLALGALVYTGFKSLNTFTDKCDKLGGQVISGRGPSLCVKDGLIVDHE